MKKLIVLALALVVIILVSGCIQEFDATEIVKTNAAVKTFLANYPRATVVASLLSNADIQEECDNPQLTVKDYWKVKVQDPDTNYTIISYVDSDSKEVVCLIKTGGLAEETEKEEITQEPISEGEECVPDWSCTSWSKCGSEGIQTRTCTDKNNCGTTINKPVEMQSCTSFCFDGTKTGECSTTKPRYCDNGTLVDKCSRCGCPEGQICGNIYCYSCGYCQYAENNVCKKYQCCSNWDCNDNNATTIDRCENPSTLNSACINKPKYPLKVGVIEFVPEDVQYGIAYYCSDRSLTSSDILTPEEMCPTGIIEKHNFLEIFNNPEGMFKFNTTYGIVPLYSVFYVNTFYENEAKKYNFMQTPIFEIEIKGPYTLYEDPPLRGRTTGSTEEIISFFKNKVEEIGINLTLYDSIVYVYFNDKPLSNRSYIGFLSFVSGKNVYASVFAYDAMGDDSVQSVMHELGHVLGATDKYIAPCSRGGPLYAACCMDPEGIPEPNKIPKYPQEKACLMCGYKALTYEGEVQGAILEDIVICEKTAKEFGWK